MSPGHITRWTLRLPCLKIRGWTGGSDRATWHSLNEWQWRGSRESHLIYSCGGYCHGRWSAVYKMLWYLLIFFVLLNIINWTSFETSSTNTKFSSSNMQPFLLVSALVASLVAAAPTWKMEKRQTDAVNGTVSFSFNHLRPCYFPFILLYRISNANYHSGRYVHPTKLERRVSNLDRSSVLRLLHHAYCPFCTLFYCLSVWITKANE